jgi:hypothetical protein
MKTTCDGCRALNGKNCNLGYKNKTKLIYFENRLINEGIVPLENCPKPKTYKELLILCKL